MTAAPAKAPMPGAISCPNPKCMAPLATFFDEAIKVDVTCRCGGHVIVNCTPMGWTDVVRAGDKARDATAKVVEAEERLAKARRDQERAIGQIGKDAGKDWLDRIAKGVAGASPSVPNIADRPIAHAGQAAGATVRGIAEALNVATLKPPTQTAKRPWWKRIFRG